MYKVLIRPLELNDASISYKWRNNPDIWQFTGSKPHKKMSEETEKKWLKNTLNNNTQKRFAIEVDDVYVGNIQLTNICNKSAEYHIFIGNKEFWNKGIAKLASYQLIRYAREVLKLQEIYLHVNSRNKAAINVYEKLGFKQVSNDIKMVLKIENLSPPRASVFLMTYNHEQFIGQAIEGALMQKTDFDFDIVIGEDCSTDNTRKIILEYNKKHPGKFKLLLHKKNIGAVENQNVILKACTGKYIAMCEGDDYWTDPLKLQKQVDFLEENEEYGLVCTDIECIDKNNNLISDHPYNIKKDKKTNSLDNFWILLKKNYIYTLTTCVRTELMNQLIHTDNTKDNEYYYDYWYWLNISLISNIKIFNKKTARYRIHENGISRDPLFFRARKDLIRSKIIMRYLHSHTIDLKQIKLISSIIISALKNPHITRTYKKTLVFNSIKYLFK